MTQELITRLDGRFGEAYAGEGTDGSHINVVLAVRGSATYAEAVRSLASPSPGHVPFLACLGLGNLVRPATVVINKITIENEQYERIFYGAAQLGISQGVSEALKEGLLDQQSVNDVALLVACWIDPKASDETKIRLFTKDAMYRAIQSAVTPVTAEYLDHQLRIYETARNNFYSGQ